VSRLSEKRNTISTQAGPLLGRDQRGSLERGSRKEDFCSQEESWQSRKNVPLVTQRRSGTYHRGTMWGGGGGRVGEGGGGGVGGGVGWGGGGGGCDLTHLLACKNSLLFITVRGAFWEETTKAILQNKGVLLLNQPMYCHPFSVRREKK